MKPVKKLQTERTCCHEDKYGKCSERATGILNGRYYCSKHYFLKKEFNRIKWKHKKELRKQDEMQTM